MTIGCMGVKVGVGASLWTTTVVAAAAAHL